MTTPDRIEAAIVFFLLVALCIFLAALINWIEKKKEKRRPYCNRIQRKRKNIQLHNTKKVG